MTIYCTTAPNDADLVHALGKCAIAIPIRVGDACFSGVSEHNKTILIAVERKKPGDLSQCIGNGRYLSQAQMAKSLGADVLVIIVEAERLRSNPDDGILEQLNWGVSPKTMRRCQVWEAVKPMIMYSRFDQYLTELDYLAGIIVKCSSCVQETASIIKALYDNFQSPPDDHQSLHQIYTQPLQGMLLHKPSLERRIAAELPGVGWQWSKVVADKFITVKDMVDASIQDWASLTHNTDGKSRKLGVKTAGKIVKALGHQEIEIKKG